MSGRGNRTRISLWVDQETLAAYSYYSEQVGLSESELMRRALNEALPEAGDLKEYLAGRKQPRLRPMAKWLGDLLENADYPEELRS